MQWIGWYSAMAPNRLTGRCGHLWEARYFSSPIEPGDTRRVLATLRYIHANPKAAGVRKGFDDPYSNDGHDEGLAGDGLSEWHPAFLQLAATLEGCARRYAQYCRHYRPRAKPARKSGWGRQAAATGWRQWREGWQQKGGGSRPAAAAVGWRWGGSAAAGRMATAGGSVPKGQRGQGKQLGLDQRGHKWLQREEKEGGLQCGNSVLLRSAISENKLFEQLWRGAGVPANKWPPCSSAEGTMEG